MPRFGATPAKAMRGSAASHETPALPDEGREPDDRHRVRAWSLSDGALVRACATDPPPHSGSGGPLARRANTAPEAPLRPERRSAPMKVRNISREASIVRRPTVRCGLRGSHPPRCAPARSKIGCACMHRDGFASLPQLACRVFRLQHRKRAKRSRPRVRHGGGALGLICPSPRGDRLLLV
jgi:hypothetical protein